MQGERKKKTRKKNPTTNQQVYNTAIRLSVIIDTFICETNHTMTKFIRIGGGRTGQYIWLGGDCVDFLASLKDC